MALIKKQLLAKEDMLLSADNTPVSQARAGTTVSVHPVNASVIPYDENRSIAEAIQGVTYTHPLTHPVSIIDGSSNPSKFVKTDAVGNTGFSDVTWSDVQGKPSSFNPNVHQHSLSDLSDAALKADKTYVDAQLSAKTDISTFTIELAKKADLNIVATGAELQAVVGTLQPLSQKGQANGYVPLDSRGKIPNSYLNSLSTIEVFTANSESNMLLLSNVGVGDQCIRTDLVSNNLFILTQTPATELTNWKQINTSVSVFSVNGQTGTVNISKTDVGLGNVDNTADLLKPLSIATTNALALKANDSTVVHNTGDETIAGVKTFSSNIVGNITGNAATATKLQTARKINGVAFDGTANITVSDSTAVKLTENQTIAGVKTFSSSPIVPTPTTNTQAANKAYVDTKQDKLGFTPVQQGTGIGQTPNVVKIGWSDTHRVKITIDETDIGNIVFDSNLQSTAVKLTGNETIAGVKTFTSSPIVPTPTLDFQSVPLRSTNITVNVGAGQTYTTINQALEYLSGFYPMYKKNGITATINLKAGFVMAEQVLVSGIDLGWITIVGEDAETIITHTSLTTSFYGPFPAFGVDKGGTSPVIGQLFRFNVEKVGGDKHGLFTVGAGSSAIVLGGKGFVGAGANGIYAVSASTVSANDANCSNAGSVGIAAVSSSTINAHGANCSNAGTCGIYAGAGSTINAYGAIIQNQTTGTSRIRVIDGSHIEAFGINTTGGTVPVFSQAVNTLTGHGIIYQ